MELDGYIREGVTFSNAPSGQQNPINERRT